MKTLRGAFITILTTLALSAVETSCAAAANASAPDLNGVWLVEKDLKALRTDAGSLPPLTSSAQASYQERWAAFQNGGIDFDRTKTRCAAPGVPRAMFLPYPFEIVQASEQLVFVLGWNHQFRHVPLGSGDPSESYFPSAMGRAGGHWEGETLVIETIGFTDDTLLDETGLPHSENLHVTERLRLIDRGRRLENRIHIEDSKAYSQSWETTVTYRKLPGANIQEDVCVERIRSGKSAIAPYDPKRWKSK